MTVKYKITFEVEAIQKQPRELLMDTTLRAAQEFARAINYCYGQGVRFDRDSFSVEEGEKGAGNE